jgi:tetratricopeptide (TPR) repeat protein
MQGKLDEAIAEIRAVKRLQPNRRMDWAILTLVGETPIGPPRPDGSQTVKVHATYTPKTRTPEEALSEVGYLHANALRAQGKLDEAIALYQEVTRLRPNYNAAYSALIPALKSQGKLDREVVASREAIRLQPDNPVAYFHLGRLLQSQEDFAGALAQYRKGHELSSEKNYSGKVDWTVNLALG